MRKKISILALVIASLAARPAYCQVSSGTAVAPPNNHSSNDYPSPSPTLHPHDPTPPPSPSPTHRVPVLHADDLTLSTPTPGGTAVPHLVHGVAEATQDGSFSPDSSPTSSVHPIDPPGPTLSGIALAEPEPSTPLKPAPSLNPVVQPVEGHHLGPPRKVLPPPSSPLRQAHSHNTGVISPTPPFEPPVPPKDPTTSPLREATPSANGHDHARPTPVRHDISLATPPPPPPTVAPHGGAISPLRSHPPFPTPTRHAIKHLPPPHSNLRQADPRNTGVIGPTPVPEWPVHPHRHPPIERHLPPVSPTPGPRDR